MIAASAGAVFVEGHVARGLVRPDLFVSLAEETGTIVPITRWIVRKVGKDMGVPLRANAGFHIAISLAPAHFAGLGVVGDTQETAKAHGIEPASAGLAAIIIDMANHLALRFIAKGVETESRMTYQREHGITHAQGRNLAKPLHTTEFIDFAARCHDRTATTEGRAPMAGDRRRKQGTGGPT